MAETGSARSLQIDLGGSHGPVSALLLLPEHVALVYVLAHGAGAGMRHPFLEAMARAVSGVGIGTLRYQFPYMEAGRRRPDPPAVAEAAVRAAVTAAAGAVPGVPLIAGGKSFGGRMTSQAAAKEPLPNVRGLVFLGFPLHPPNLPGETRAAHLAAVTVPLLFLQGTRDAFARRDLIEGVCRRLGPRATLHWVEDGDHSFNVPKRGGGTAAQVIEGLALTIAAWGQGVSGKR
jgi:predicted alpha/beta-hydrolase family hydrolase